MFGMRPTETSARSTRMVSVLPSAFVMTYSTLPSTTFRLSSFDARWITTPIDSKLDATSSATSSSSNGRMRGWRSMMWIFVLPKLAKIVAYSQPMTPAPTMTMLSGNDGNASI